MSSNAAPAMIDTISGQVHAMFVILPMGLPHVQAGKVRALGVTERSARLVAAELPTVAESGIPGFAVRLTSAPGGC
jgi:tripartite-type tricarboxylate transporter receptor subunit TctC